MVVTFMIFECHCCRSKNSPVEGQSFTPPFPASHRMEVADVPLMVAFTWFHFLLGLKVSLYTNSELGVKYMLQLEHQEVSWKHGRMCCS